MPKSDTQASSEVARCVSLSQGVLLPLPAVGSRKRDARCGLGSLESVVRPCRWDDKLYTHYFDHTSNRCEPWDKTACTSDAFPRLAECLRACVGPRSKYQKQRHGVPH